ncbi:MAG TPA: hypothetical protein VFH27_08050, partial [Longimicrobiaceae bacterium]|nr:hypothetical protein [Longimicrobiaceae bacterium]
MGTAEGGVLLIGGDAETGRAARDASAAAGLPFASAASLSDGLRMLAAGARQATVLDVDLAEGDQALLERIAALPNAGALVLVAAAPSLRLAMDAARLGAAELVAAPLTAEVLLRV